MSFLQVQIKKLKAVVCQRGEACVCCGEALEQLESLLQPVGFFLQLSVQ